MDFWSIVSLLFLVGLVAMFLYDGTRPTVIPQLRGHVEQPFLGPPALVITAFHQHPGNLRRGRLQVMISGPQVRDPSGQNTQTHSFELWEPNEDHPVVLRFPLREYDPTQEIPIRFSLQAAGIQDSVYADAWVGEGWKSNQK